MGLKITLHRWHGNGLTSHFQRAQTVWSPFHANCRVQISYWRTRRKNPPAIPFLQNRRSIPTRNSWNGPSGVLSVRRYFFFSAPRCRFKLRNNFVICIREYFGYAAASSWEKRLEISSFAVRSVISDAVRHARKLARVDIIASHRGLFFIAYVRTCE